MNDTPLSGDASSSPRDESVPSSPPPRSHSPRKHWLNRATASVFVVTLASGVLFAFSASQAQRSEPIGDLDLVEIVRNQQNAVTSLKNDKAALQEQIDALVDTEQSSSETSSEFIASPSTPITGPGLTVSLDDSSLTTVPEGRTANDLVIHQQDIEDLMNALWRGGAEAMTVQGHRVGPTTVIQCIGNVILVDGTSYSPPYKVAAIGDQKKMQQALDTDPQLNIYKKYVTQYFLGWDVENNDSLSFEASLAEPSNKFAEIVRKM